MKHFRLLFICLILAALIVPVFNVVPVGAADPVVIDKQVVASSDDIAFYWDGAAWTGSPSTAMQNVGYSNSGYARQGGGLRFVGITIPSGALITNAYISIKASSNSSNDTVNSYITGNKQDNPAAWSTTSNYKTRRGTVVGGADDTNITTAQVAWDSIGSWTSGTWYNSPDISTVIQELIDTHAPNNEAIALFWDDHDNRSTNVNSTSRLGNSYNNNASYGAKLHIEYITPPTVTLSAASSITSTSARINGNVTATGGDDPTVTMYWGDDDAGQVAGDWDNSSAPTSPAQPQGVAAFYKDLAGLDPGTTYYFSAMASNSAGDSWPAASGSFVTIPAAPTNLAATDGTHSDKVVATWTKSTGATGYKVYRDLNLIATLGDVATYDDTGADAPIITPGTATATDGTSSTHVTLSLAGESVADGTHHTYHVKAFNATGDSEYSDANTGYKGAATPTYQWQRSAGDSNATYANIAGGTTNPYNDTAAPAYVSPDVVGRYFRCVVSATGATDQTSTAERGYRVGLPVVIPKAASNISFTTSKINFEVTDDGGDPACQVRIGYGTVSHIAADFENYTTKTAWAGAYETSDTDGVTVINLTIDTVFYYRIQIKNADGTAVTSTTELYLDTTAMPSMLSDYVIPGGTGFLTDDPLMPPKMYTEGDTEVLPLGLLIDELAEQSSSDPLDQEATKMLWLYLTVFIGIGVLSLCVFGLSRRGGGEGSNLLMFIVIMSCLILFGLIGTAADKSLIPLFPAFLYLVGDAALLMSEKHFGWG